MSKFKFIIIGIITLLAGFFAYNYFFVSDEDTSAKLKDVSKGDSSVTGSTAADTSKTTSPTSKEVNQNEQYVKQLIALKAISFNFDLFSDDAYKILHAANTDIPPEEKGRHNPFAPVEAGDGAYISPSSTTTTGFQITSTSTPPLRPTASTTPRFPAPTAPRTTN